MGVISCTVISCGLPSGYAIFPPQKSVGAGYLTYFLLLSFTNKFCINFIRPILLYGYFILNISRQLALNQLNFSF
jgi:hypothetical protein